ncbi:hypothetical protein OKW21_003150 [Catalinimonas alkaloidigena]|uniref:hypothetical protein n=1 Tax=Catalinimonas alkaloidigena TaxID=1075417 RepID=UPI00240513BB|nr:hypothetical protein [Catalinimonas alkaloidigena]MDF9797887.1 hypothetical protein [Catalinimonas alkaloidigena]
MGAIQDRQCKHSQVEVLEQSPALIVVHWRYAVTDAHYKNHHNEWVDEYYFFYPDGLGVRQVNLGMFVQASETFPFLEDNVCRTTYLYFACFSS